ncbi:MAG: acetolactate synthase small subunit [Oscillospiraceae bacterium]|nr:acetolactate synthase small subunit [Oscillospiraceae bacterium]
MECVKFTISVIVKNRFGVLARVAGLFSKRGYNIDRLSAIPIDGTDESEILLTSSGDENTRNQIIKQLEKLYDVMTVEIISMQ